MEVAYLYFRRECSIGCFQVTCLHRRPRARWIDHIRRDSNISPNSGGVPSTVAMLLERRNGPRRLHDIDDDDGAMMMMMIFSGCSGVLENVH